jgi:hypothetical protein
MVERLVNVRIRQCKAGKPKVPRHPQIAGLIDAGEACFMAAVTVESTYG